MKTIILSLTVAVGIFAASPAAPAKKADADSTKLLRIDAQIPAAWDVDEWFRDELEASLSGFHKFKVIPHAQIEHFLAKAQIEPARRDSSAEALLESHFAAPYRLTFHIEAPTQIAGRRTVIFFMGERSLKLDASVRLYATDAHIPELRGDFSIDTSIAMGYCGLLDCQVQPLDAQHRILVERDLFRRLEAKIKDRIEQLMVIPAEHKVRQDSLRVVATRDSIKAVRTADSLRAKAKADSLKAPKTDTTKAAKPDSSKVDTTKKTEPTK